ncbi:unnamed protein product [Sphagnum balticum]
MERNAENSSSNYNRRLPERDLFRQNNIRPSIDESKFLLPNFNIYTPRPKGVTSGATVEVVATPKRNAPASTPNENGSAPILPNENPPKQTLIPPHISGSLPIPDDGPPKPTLIPPHVCGSLPIPNDGPPKPTLIPPPPQMMSASIAIGSTPSPLMPALMAKTTPSLPIPAVGNVDPLSSPLQPLTSFATVPPSPLPVKSFPINGTNGVTPLNHFGGVNGVTSFIPLGTPNLSTINQPNAVKTINGGFTTETSNGGTMTPINPGGMSPHQEFNSPGGVISNPTAMSLRQEFNPVGSTSFNAMESRHLKYSIQWGHPHE